MENRPSPITDLPLDVLLLIFPYLDVKSFLSLCSTCKALHQPSIRLEPSYWRTATRSTFRVRNQPVVENDGARWQQMYRRLLTQTRVYTWGSNGHSRLGHSYTNNTLELITPRVVRPGRPGGPGGPRRQNRMPFGIPIEMEDTQGLGIIADMQCGGWSTTLLTSKGTLHTAGVMDGQRSMRATHRLQKLTFPADAQHDETTNAIRHFSAGRSHILALSDSGRMWSWNDATQPAVHVKFAGLEIQEAPLSADRPSSRYGVVRQVVAGWSRSSAYVQGVGIVVWKPVEQENPRGNDEAHTAPGLEYGEVSKTGYKRVKDTSGESEYEKALGAEVGSVLNYIILEHFVVFNTDLGKVFCGRFGDDNNVDTILELRLFRTEKVTSFDVQGSFRRFAVFRHEEIVIVEQEYLEACWEARQTDLEQTDIQRGLGRIPALQHKDIVEIAFGDYHYLALHSSGKITSYGSEMNACGALGLGSDGSREGGHSRGVVYDQSNLSTQGIVLPHGYYTHGRQVWFDDRKRDWLDHVINGRTDPDESKERRALFKSNHNASGEVTEWIEQESRAWDEAEEKGGLGAYFALGVSAAGWHSGALVLVNEELADKEPEYKWEQMRFPRLRLWDGTDMPGTKDFDEWRNGRPEWPWNGRPEWPIGAVP